MRCCQQLKMGCTMACAALLLQLCSLTITTATEQGSIIRARVVETRSTSLTLSSESGCGNYTNFTSWKGNQLLNFTVDFPPDIVYSEGSSICCTTAVNAARSRSKNSSDPVGWSVEVLGPSKTHLGQTSLLCVGALVTDLV